jgi:AMP-activated protein kinase-like protein
MSDDRRQDDDEALGERVARVLRPIERFDHNFETDLVEAIRADRAIEPRLAPRTRPLAPAWWATPRTLRLSPIAGLAMAASLAAIVSLGTLGVSRSRPFGPVSMTAQAVHDTVNVVRFVFVGQAKTVSLVGDFNAWGAQPVSLEPTGSNGTWSASIPLPSGRHEYAFIVDGQRWVADPFAPSTSDEFNTNSSIITVGS